MTADRFDDEVPTEEGTVLQESLFAPDTIPEELIGRDQWVCWEYEGTGGKRKKKPIDPNSGTGVDVTDPDEWLTFDHAREYAEAKNRVGDGIGFVFTAEDPFVGIDVDDCRRDGEFTEQSMAIIELLDSYTEISPSGTGVHIIVTGELPGDRARRNNVEMYESARFFTMTGNHLGDTPTRIEERRAALDEIYDMCLTEDSPEQDREQNGSGTEAAAVLCEKSNASSSSQPPINEPRLKGELTAVLSTIKQNFPEQYVVATEAALATVGTLLLDTDGCSGLILVGPSGSGKTTVLKFFDSLDIVYRSDHVTPAAFVSQDASQSTAELKETDLLPRIRYKTLVVPDLSGWFSGDRDRIRERFSRVATTMDGQGFTRDAGTHGQRGYDDDYPFSVLGASTPLKPRAWTAMGNTGNRFVFIGMPSKTDTEDAVEHVIDHGEGPYHQRVSNCRESVHDLLQLTWDAYGGYGSVDSESLSASDDIHELLSYLTDVVRHARNPMENEEREGAYRIVRMFWDLARGRAILSGRSEVIPEDMEMCARIALSTMPKARRPVVRVLLDPKTEQPLDARTLVQRTGITKPTAYKRLKLLEDLEFATAVKRNDNGNPLSVKPRSTFEWPDAIPFPRWYEG